MNKSYESMEEMQRMQQEAVRRVKEMQKRAKQSLVAGNRYSESSGVKENNIKEKVLDEDNCNKNENKLSEKPILSENNCNINQNKNVLRKSKQKNDFFSELLKDSEKSLILLLIILLVDEGSDMSLILALMYLIF
mgnify:CR=1 FL=1